jgi:hypothetical protein
MWVGVCLSVLVELVPENLRTTGVGFYFFVISNIGGNMQLLLPPVKKAIKESFKLNDVDALRGNFEYFFFIFICVPKLDKQCVSFCIKNINFISMKTYLICLILILRLK